MKRYRSNAKAPPLQGRGWGGAADGTEFIRQLYARAAEMRRNPTPFEAIVWKHLSRSQLSDAKFRRQHVLTPYIVDFFCPGKNLAIEIDGHTHDAERDRSRDFHLSKAGVKVLRFSNNDVATNIEGVIETIRAFIGQSADRWNKHPHPNPSPEGEGP